MQRYHMQASHPTIERIADSEGLYVLHSEAQARIEALQAELSAERERRVEAEQAIDEVIEEGSRNPCLHYRVMYPKGDDHG